MSAYDAVYLVLCAALLVALLRRGDSDRLFALLVAILLVPRELNARVGAVSVSLTDVTFLAFVAPWVARIQLGGVREVARRLRRPEQALAFAGLAYLALAALLNVLLERPFSVRMFARDLLVYGGFFTLLLAVLDLRLHWERRHVLAMLCVLVGWSLVAVAIATIPRLREEYVSAHIAIHVLSSRLGFFDPSAGAGPFTENGSLRIVDFVGGAPIGLFLLALFPLLFTLRVSFTSAGAAALSALVFYGSLHALSRALALGAVVTIASCTLLYRARRAAVLASAGCCAAVFVSPMGSQLFRRFGLLGQLDPEASHGIRWAMLKQGWRYFSENPLLGIGIGAQAPFQHGARTVLTDGVDSLFPTVFLKLGVAGGAIFTGLFGYAVVRALRSSGWRASDAAAAETDQDFAVPPAVAFLPFITGFLVLSLFTYPVGNVSASLFVATALGLFLNAAAPRRAYLTTAPGLRL
ncbi:MAG: O-antigen ligase family protein [Gemmatimonadaceae bacterium]